MMIRLFTFVILLSIGFTVSEDCGEYCYKDEDGCGPSTCAWPPTCHNGENQSPITLPPGQSPSGAFSLRIVNVYRGDFFRMQNSGHSLYIDFVGESGENEGPTAQPITFPDPLTVDQPSNTRQYKFVSAHFHWGTSDKSGSEHCIGHSCAALEAHFVHYWTKYDSLREAMDSGDENALAVLGALINPSSPNQPPSFDPQPPSVVTSALAPIIKHLDLVKYPGGFVRVNEALDFTDLIGGSSPSQMYSYKGSLTSPKCEEQVNWFVRRNVATVPHDNLEAIRTQLKDAHKKVLDQNHRPIQDAHKRKIVLSNVFQTAV